MPDFILPLLAGLALPFLLVGQTIRSRFQDGTVTGLGFLVGAWVIGVPVAFGLVWLGRKLASLVLG